MNKRNRSIVKVELDKVKKDVGNGFLLSSEYTSGMVESPSTFTLSIVKKVFSYEGSVGSAYSQLGVDVKPFDVESYVVPFLSRFYLNLRAEEEFLYSNVGYTYQYSNNRIYLIKKIYSPLTLYRFLKYTFKQIELIRDIENHIENFNVIANSWRVLDLEYSYSELNFDQSLDELRSNVDSFVDQYSSIYKIAIIEDIFHQYVKSRIKGELKDQYLISNDKNRNLYKRSIEAVDQLVEGEIEMDQFIDKYGVRSFNDFEFSAPRWFEIEDQLFNHFSQRKESTNANYLHNFGLDVDISSTLKKSQREMITQLKDLVTIKDNMRFLILKRVSVIRSLLLRISEITSFGDMIFFLTFDEVMNLPEMNIAKLKKVAKERFEKYSTQIEILLPTVITSRTVFEQSKVDEAKTYLNGVAVSPGYVQGELIFINNPLQQVPSGSIIVLPTAGPEYAHLYSQAKGIIFQKGGILSHGAIITREFRIPALVVQNSEKIRTWENKQVVLDAQKARIILSKE